MELKSLHVKFELDDVSAQRNLSAKDAASFITPTALLMVQTVEASPVWPMLLVRTAETVIGAFAALVVISVGYVRKYPEVVLPRR